MNASTPVTPGLPGILMEVTAERQRQVKDLGYDLEHDDTHDPDAMAVLSQTYTRRARNDLSTWPSDARMSEARDNLVKAAALLVATIERLDRQVAQDA